MSNDFFLHAIDIIVIGKKIRFQDRFDGGLGANSRKCLNLYIRRIFRVPFKPVNIDITARKKALSIIS
jgi:hypothetical protein